jgi:hypothetical protein
VTRLSPDVDALIRGLDPAIIAVICGPMPLEVVVVRKSWAKTTGVVIVINGIEASELVAVTAVMGGRAVIEELTAVKVAVQAVDTTVKVVKVAVEVAIVIG